MNKQEKFNLIEKFINDPNDFNIDFYYWEFLEELKKILDLYNKEKKKTEKLKKDREILYGVIDEINEKHNKLINNILQLYNNKYTEYELTIALRKLLEEIDND